jgi:hypothetical protein
MEACVERFAVGSPSPLTRTEHCRPAARGRSSPPFGLHRQLENSSIQTGTYAGSFARSLERRRSDCFIVLMVLANALK